MVLGLSISILYFKRPIKGGLVLKRRLKALTRMLQEGVGVSEQAHMGGGAVSKEA